MLNNKLFNQILLNLNSILKQDTAFSASLWKEFIKVHPADIADFLESLDEPTLEKIFKHLSSSLKVSVFKYLPNTLKVSTLSFLSSQDRGKLLSSLPIDELTDFFDDLSDEELKKYLKLLHKKDREKVLSLLKFDPNSAGGIMDTDVLTLMDKFTVEKAIEILQRLQPRQDLHRYIFITNFDDELVGYIRLEDLVLEKPKTRISKITRKPAYVALVQEDQEDIAQKMTHYQITIAPVVDKHNVFLGVISSDTLVNIIEQEAAEDVYRISGVKPMKYTYFETPFLTLVYQRSSILVILLLLQTFSSAILQWYEGLLCGFFSFFVTMLTSTGGNTSSQTSALVIQGMSSGEIKEKDMKRFLSREFRMAVVIALILAVISFIRIYFTNTGEIVKNMAVSLSLGTIVMLSVMLGSFVPIVLKRFKLDPALSAGPFLATVMDVLGLLVYCFIAQLIVGKLG